MATRNGAAWRGSVCGAPGCRQEATALGLCPRHYQQVRAWGRLTPEREHQRQGERCLASGCGRKPLAKGYCSRHYRQVQQHGPRAVRGRPARAPTGGRPSGIPRARRIGEHAAAGAPRPRRSTVVPVLAEHGQACRVAGCAGEAVSRGLCSRHYQQVLNHGRLTPEREHHRQGERCSVEACMRRPRARGYCTRHYLQLRR